MSVGEQKEGEGKARAKHIVTGYFCNLKIGVT